MCIQLLAGVLEKWLGVAFTDWASTPSPDRVVRVIAPTLGTKTSLLAKACHWPSLAAPRTLITF